MNNGNEGLENLKEIESLKKEIDLVREEAQVTQLQLEKKIQQGFLHSLDPKRTFHRWIDRRRQERRFALSYASEEGELLDALENVVSYVPLLRGARAFSQA